MQTAFCFTFDSGNDKTGRQAIVLLINQYILQIHISGWLMNNKATVFILYFITYDNTVDLLQVMVTFLFN